MKIVIMAGGQGTRLWPMSRHNRPKQLFNLVSNQSLLKDTIDRLTPLFPQKDIYIATTESYIKLIKKQIPDFPLENIFSEPSTRDTSACIGLATLRIMKTDPKAIIAILSADHYIGNEKKFRQLLQKAGKLAKRDNKIVILGIKPTRPATEFGYINIGKSGKNIEKTKVFTVKKFVEKPDLPTAKKYVKSWKYFWNAGMFIYPVSVMMEKIAQNMPQNHKILMKISQHLGSKDENNQIKKLYEQMDKISIDYGVLERSSDLLMIPADINWNDIGTWGTLKDMLSNDDSDNITKGDLITIDTTGSLIYGHKKTIITLGVEDMVIVDTDDVMLVCPKNKSADIKKIIELLKNKKLDQYL